MPYVSKAQARAMHTKAEAGEIPQAVVDEFDEASKGKKLPEKKPIRKWAESKRGK